METFGRIWALGCTSRIVEEALEWVGGLKLIKMNMYTTFGHISYIYSFQKLEMFTLSGSIIFSNFCESMSSLMHFIGSIRGYWNKAYTVSITATVHQD